MPQRHLSYRAILIPAATIRGIEAFLPQQERGISASGVDSAKFAWIRMPG